MQAMHSRRRLGMEASSFTTASQKLAILLICVVFHLAVPLIPLSLMYSTARASLFSFNASVYMADHQPCHKVWLLGSASSGI